MKMSGSDWDLEEFLRPVGGEDGDERSPSPEELEELEELLLRPSGKTWGCGGEDGDERSPSPEELEELLLRPSEKARACGGGGGGGDGISFADVCGFGFTGHHQRDAIEALTSEGQVGQIWSESHNNNNLTPRQYSSISAAMDSQSSLCTGSPTSSLKPKGVENLAPGGTSGSEQSDDESLDIEGGSYEQGTNISELKRMRRYGWKFMLLKRNQEYKILE